MGSGGPGEPLPAESTKEAPTSTLAVPERGEHGRATTVDLASRLLPFSVVEKTMRPRTSIAGRWLFLAGCIGVGYFGLASPALAQTPTYTNAEVVSVDPQTRTLVIKAKDGAEQTVELDDTVGGLADISAGDHVIVALRGEPGRNRVSSLAKSTPAPSVPVDSNSKTPALTTPSATDKAAAITARGAATTFAERVATLSAQATKVDSLWVGFRSNCKVVMDRPYDNGREWFVLWDQPVQADFTTGFCRDLFNQIIGQGEAIKQAMKSAEESVRDDLLPGAIRDVRRRYSMEWDGWDRPAPEPLTL
jgi:hypothetical protein